jgi:hypothetical protein
MILTLGCSFTAGEELDNVDQAWPSLIGQRLGQPVENLGESGSCNASMVRKLLAHTSHCAYDLVVIGWTDPNRFEAWHEQQHRPVTIMIDSQAGLAWTDDYYRYSYNPQWAWERWIDQVVLAQEYLTARNQPYLFVSVAGTPDYNDRSQQIAHVCQLIRADRFVGWPARGMIQIAADAEQGPGGHPLARGHERIANEIISYIRN